MAKISKKPQDEQAGAEPDDINRFIIEGLRDAGLITNPEPATHAPNVDVYSTRAELIIEIEMPGVRREDIDVTLLKDAISIKAVKAECFEDAKVNYVCMERSFGRIFRQIEIPFAVDAARIKAVYKNGLLTVTIPRVVDKRSMTRKVNVESV
ncbi:MAG: Hsp20/alpha crystallin family protein [Deltaproteobacteria bacterium]|nr:Hsp20/alpha crystallin family protein [Deltaproteobacteria bacterium]